MKKRLFTFILIGISSILPNTFIVTKGIDLLFDEASFVQTICLFVILFMTIESCEQILGGIFISFFCRKRRTFRRNK